MLKTSPTSIVLQLLIDVASKNEDGRDKGNSNKTNLSNSFISKKFTRAGYLTFKDSKKSGGSIRKDVRATRGSNYLILDA